ncbi:hypothetical protein [Halopelagius longus]|uniref:DUF8060 domain-containing protein n=1 Tax=Halopelagius longus TaxID=1236180 RepID=A0A1H0YEB9_9EURY|nr:hypothetical protein [Halopelagius longus]RDI72427.1 hypothetical protein DWB78_12275 [Halopelagius longus]SDQ13206.1 hypothetical protein SAMN05216278_0570 [Halopelagius longus]
MTDANPDPDPDDGGTDARQTDRQEWPDPSRGGGESTAEQLKRYLNYAVLAGLILVALVSVFQLYSAVTRTINTFVTPEYRAPFLAAFNLVVLLIAALGVSLQLKRLQE